MKLYGVVIMDVIDSRSMPNRLQFQDNLIQYFNQVNKKYKKILSAPISITLGDEWQAITQSPAECYEIVHEFQQYLWQAGVEAYAGIGIGGLATDIYSDVRLMDGPCFHAARNAIEIARNQVKTKSKLIYSKHNKVYFYASSVSISNADEGFIDNDHKLKSKKTSGLRNNSLVPLPWWEAAATIDTDHYSPLAIEELINTLIENNEILKGRMTPKQRRIYIDYIRHGTYRKILAEYGNSETIGGISQKLNSAEFFTIQRNQKIIKKLLSIYCVLGELT